MMANGDTVDSAGLRMTADWALQACGDVAAHRAGVSLQRWLPSVVTRARERTTRRDSRGWLLVACAKSKRSGHKLQTSIEKSFDFSLPHITSFLFILQLYR